jgi:DNA-binding CsgD family transcriptional regulator
MHGDDDVLDLIGDIYDASLDPALWIGVLENACAYVQGATATVMSQDSAYKSAEFHFQWGNDPQYLQLYQDIYVKLNPVLVPTLLYSKVGDILSTVDLIPYDEFLSSRFYKEWVAPQGYVDSIFTTLDKSSTGYAFFAVTRHKRHGLVDDAARRRMGLLAPHFRRAVAIGKVIDLHKVEAAALADTLDGLVAGMFLVDAAGRLVHANASGHRMLADKSVIQIIGSRFAAFDAPADRALSEVFAAARVGDAAVGRGGVAVPMSARNDERYVAHVLPLTSGARRQAGVTYAATAAVFVRKAALDLPSPIETLAKVYHLTPAELRVLFAIVEIGGVPEVAPVLGLSEPTVRSHLQHLFEKTGTDRQADLVKLVAVYMSPLVS